MEGKILSERQEIDLDTAYAIGRAAEGLDEIMQIARDKKDAKSALQVVNGWLTIAALLDVDDDDEEDRPKHRTGFHHE